jgi:thiamine-monophosphate kinase
MPHEFDLIAWIRSQQKKSRLVTLPAGDDLAVLKWDEDDLLLVGNDQVLDGVHFDSTKHDARSIGRKVMNRNLSDCAAMACLPAAAVITVALPRGTSMEFAKELYLGIKEAGDPYYCAIVGGDTATWDGKLVVTVSILGRSAGVTPVKRSGAKVGDAIYVTGPLGGSILGRHMNIEPRVFLSREIAKKKRAHAMIDLSDGLSRDLKHICEQSEVGAIIEASQIPIHDDARKLAERSGKSALDHALHDGEDYELLFTGPQPLPKEFIKIGQITEQPGLFIEIDGHQKHLETKGWEHQL